MSVRRSGLVAILGLSPALLQGCEESNEPADIVEAPTAEELGPAPAIPASGWYRSAGQFDALVTRASPATRPPRNLADLDPLEALNHACAVADPEFRPDGIELSIEWCPERPWCQWGLERALASSGESRDRWAHSLAACSGVEAWALFGPDGGVSDAALLRRARSAPWEEPLYLPPAVMRGVIRDRSQQQLQIIFDFNRANIDAELWKREVNAALDQADTLAERARLGRALGGFEDDASIQAWKAGCNVEFTGCATSETSPPAPGSAFVDTLTRLAGAGELELRRVIAQVRHRTPDAPVVDALVTCGESASSPSMAAHACIGVLVDDQPERAIELAKKRLSSEFRDSDATRRWLRAISDGRTDALAVNLAELDLLPKGASSNGVRSGADAIDLMRAHYRALLAFEIDAAGDAPWYALHRLLSLANLSGVSVDIEHEDSGDVGLVYNGTRYSVQLVDHGGDRRGRLLAMVGLVNRVAELAGTPRRLSVQRGPIDAVVAASPEAFRAGVSAGYLSGGQPSSVDWQQWRGGQWRGSTDYDEADGY